MTTVYFAGVFEFIENGATDKMTTYYEGNAMRRSGYGIDDGVFYLLQDHLKSSSSFVNQSGATLANNYYYPYGGNRGGAFSNLTTKRFTGQYHESSLPGGEGLSYYGARWYDAKLGRFLSADTIVPGPANPQAFNRYSYVFNNPLNFTDPTGHDPWGGRREDPRDRLHGASDLLPPTIRELYTTFYQTFRAHPVAQFYDGRWSTFAQDFVAATQATGATNLVGYNEMADYMANSLAGRGKGATGGLISTSDALYFFLLGLDNDFQAILAQKEDERVEQLTGVLGMSLMFSSVSYTEQSRTHAYEHGHAANSPRIPGQSRFLPTEGGQKFTNEVINHPTVVIDPQGNGRIRYSVADLGRNVGYDVLGNLTRGGVVIVEGPVPATWSTYRPNEVVTQFPN